MREWNGPAQREAARLAHEALRRWRRWMREPELPRWEFAPRWMHESTLAMVAHVIDGRGPADLHELWMRHKLAAGWKLGERDADARTHPDLVPYTELPLASRIKDSIMLAEVRYFGASTGRMSQWMPGDIESERRDVEVALPQLAAVDVAGREDYVGSAWHWWPTMPMGDVPSPWTVSLRLDDRATLEMTWDGAGEGFPVDGAMTAVGACAASAAAVLGLTLRDAPRTWLGPEVLRVTVAQLVATDEVAGGAPEFDAEGGGHDSE